MSITAQLSRLPVSQLSMHVGQFLFFQFQLLRIDLERAFVSSRLDYCNSLSCYVISDGLLKKLLTLTCMGRL